MEITTRLTTVFLLAILTTSSAQTTCQMSGSTIPVAGLCAGPMARTQMTRNNANITNTGCQLNQVPYYVEGVTTSPLRCGRCVPGTSGAEDSGKTCGINEYCTDDAACAPVGNQPFNGLPCPFERGGRTATGWCGPGLRCIQHVCRGCEEGVLDPTDGKMCVFGAWTYSRWAQVFYNPPAVILGFLALCVLIQIIVLITSHCLESKQTKKRDDSALLIAQLQEQLRKANIQPAGGPSDDEFDSASDDDDTTTDSDQQTTPARKVSAAKKKRPVTPQQRVASPVRSPQRRPPESPSRSGGSRQQLRTPVSGVDAMDDFEQDTMTDSPTRPLRGSPSSRQHLIASPNSRRPSEAPSRQGRRGAKDPSYY
eukprot:TRINITY_DN10875_c0_g3_i1.p1 TRINITY_DN10875_c0_g3~~TRINITY_DN10875_c0_g3_i1.p1  ORF type:complete len:367 (+),score=37.60 TRINITY_DN10875_c0_g3_i1:69-1169(+)